MNLPEYVNGLEDHAYDLEESNSTDSEMNSIADDVFSESSSVATCSIADLTKLCSPKLSGGYLNNMLWKEKVQTRHLEIPGRRRRSSSVSMPFVEPNSAPKLPKSRERRRRTSSLSAAEDAYREGTIGEEISGIYGKISWPFFRVIN